MKNLSSIKKKVFNGEKDIEEITETLLKNKSISPDERIRFLGTNFWTIMEIAGDRLEVEYKSEDRAVAVPYIITAITEKAPNFFDHLEIDAEVFHYEHPKKDITSKEMSSEEKRKFIYTKKEFNESLDRYIKDAVWFGQITEDYDILGDANSLEESDLKKEHRLMGDSRLQAFEEAIKKNKNAELNVLMRIVKNDTVTPVAVYPASKLMDIGVTVYNYERGEKIGAFKAGKVLSNHGAKIEVNRKRLGIDIKDLSDATSLDKKKLEKYEEGELKINYRDAQVLEDFFKKQRDWITHFNGSAQLVKDEFYIFTVSRKFPAEMPGVQQQPAEPQFHKEFTGVISKGWKQAFNCVKYYIEEKRGRPYTKNDLKQFGY